MSPSSSVILPSEFDISNLTYGDVVERKNGSKVVYPLYKNKPIYFQTPQMYAPFGITSFNNEPGKPEDYSMNLSFQGKNERKSLQKLYDVMDAIDKSNVKQAFENCSSWLNKKKVNSTDVVEALYTPIIREPREDKYSPTFKLKLPFYEGMFKTQFYDKSQNIMNIKNHLADMKNAKCKAVIVCTGIWLIGGKFGCSWQCEQVECVLQEKLSGYVIRNVPDDDIDTEDIVESVIDGNATKTENPEKQMNDMTLENKEDDDGEDIESDDDSDEDDEVPIPVIVKKKK
jgi:hypothetical protein